MQKQQIENIPFNKVKRQPFLFDICSIQELYDRFHDSEVNLFKPHRIQFNGLTIFCKGTSKHMIDFEEKTIDPGTILPSLKGQVHAFQKELNVKGIVISFDESFIVQGLSESNMFHFLQLYHTPHLHIGEENLTKLKPYLDKLIKLQESSNPNLKPELIQSIFISLILEIKRNSIYQHKTFQSQRYKDFMKFQDLISNHHTETHDAHDYAKMLHVSYKHLNELCKEMVNKTAKVFIDSWLILEIKRKLTEDIFTSQEIAYALGFSDPSNFVRFFKKHEKMTPTLFLKNLKNNSG